MKQLPKGWKVIQGSKTLVLREKTMEQNMREYARSVDSEIEAAMKQNLDELLTEEQKKRTTNIIMGKLERESRK